MQVVKYTLVEFYRQILKWTDARVNGVLDDQSCRRTPSEKNLMNEL